MFRKFDLPPLWLLACLCLAWMQKSALPLGLGFGPVWADLLGGLLVGGGVLMAVLALVEMRRARTTFMPHEEPDSLVTSGVFRLSRNPIYLGDVMILAGFILFWDAVPSLVLLPIYVWLLEKRFIEPEEARLRRKFVASFRKYETQTRRWL
ncbi:isoprenylcysteine carboxylmethyltransferase family protein [Yangia mangrovi]|uniref:Isoprenylcysteine carboxylmethyltransferase family protein n=1 Tax=Alloyangia mangrovi TaxID=1779329 RepID=A0A2A3JVQ8_9RHOB|nr:isoprenylcysteine carboxylmethyltransferase family protein [Alloyangia mangrovi]MCA0940951.1 isoprenylcysteine carboxylmethyltransferase family protein [Alloyangia pacifica]MCA0944291.1 isoprenylcysteine carboxylmethyltransferase family protein [Alloyangia pacifica]MCT4369609.1 isoprenylcysteine carboxylmethyltransferase family protein [Alloyangia mangrovi]